MLSYSRNKIRPPIKCHGGKSYLTRRLLDLAPKQYDCILDVYGGGGNIILNTPDIISNKIYNDADWFKSNLLRTIQNKQTFLDFYNIIINTQYAETTFINAKSLHKINTTLHNSNQLQIDNSSIMVDCAVQYIITNRMSRGGLNKDFAWSERLRGGQPGDLNAWISMLDHLPVLYTRLMNIQIDNIPGYQCINKYRHIHNKFIYLDPPYIQETRTAKHAYGQFEMPTMKAEAINDQLDTHEYLIETIKVSYDRVMISGYHSELYDTKLKDWNLVEIDIANHSGQNKEKQRRLECVWMNY